MTSMAWSSPASNSSAASSTPYWAQPNAATTTSYRRTSSPAKTPARTPTTSPSATTSGTTAPGTCSQQPHRSSTPGAPDTPSCCRNHGQSDAVTIGADSGMCGCSASDAEAQLSCPRVAQDGGCERTAHRRVVLEPSGPRSTHHGCVNMAERLLVRQVEPKSEAVDAHHDPAQFGTGGERRPGLGWVRMETPHLVRHEAEAYVSG